MRASSEEFMFGCACMSEQFLLAYAVSTKIPWWPIFHCSVGPDLDPNCRRQKSPEAKITKPASMQLLSAHYEATVPMLNIKSLCMSNDWSPSTSILGHVET